MIVLFCVSIASFLLIDGVLLNRKEVLSLIYSMNETDGICKRLLTVLGALEHHNSAENLEIQLQIALDGYQLPNIVELPIEMEEDANNE